MCVQMPLNSSPHGGIADSAPGTEGVKREIFYLDHGGEMIRFLDEKDEENESNKTRNHRPGSACVPYQKS